MVQAQKEINHLRFKIESILGYVEKKCAGIMPQTLEEEEVEIVFCSEEDPPLKDFIELRFILKRLEYRNKFKDFLWDNTLQVTNMKDLD